MMRSLFSGVSGLRNHQVRLDVIGNNIANVNTVAYKSSRVTFEEAFAQLVQGASRPAGESGNIAGGTNPLQIGLGMNIGSIDLLFTQGNLENTGVTTDLAIQGDSFFVVSNGTQSYYTRSGNFQLDATGRLVSSTNGWVVQGKMGTDGVLSDTIKDLQLPFGQKSKANNTDKVSIGGNLNAEALLASSDRETTIAVYDAQGTKHDLSIKFSKVEDLPGNPGTWLNNNWNAEIKITGNDPGQADPTVNIRVILNEDGTLRQINAVPADPANAPAGTRGTYDFVYRPDGFGADQTISLDFGEINGLDGLSQFAAPSTAVIREQDGYTMGQLERVSIDSAGNIHGAFTNGVTLTLAQIVLADFNNPSGLIRVGDNMYTISPNTGAPVLGYAGEGSQSTITSGALEMSNVDLAQEFTSMITAQRGFQSNARVITASDEMLQELVNLKR